MEKKRKFIQELCGLGYESFSRFSLSLPWMCGITRGNVFISFRLLDIFGIYDDVFGSE